MAKVYQKVFVSLQLNIFIYFIILDFSKILLCQHSLAESELFDSKNIFINTYQPL